MTVLDVALSNGYSAPEPFTRALRRLIGQSPRAFRERPDWDALQSALQPLGDMRSRHMIAEFTLDAVSIVRFPETRVALLAHRGDPRRLGDSIRRFIAWRKRNALPPQRSETYNICHDDPEDCDPEAFRFDLCAATLGEILPNDEGVEVGTIPAGRCALLRLIGPDDRLDAAARFLYGTWLPQSGEEPVPAAREILSGSAGISCDYGALPAAAIAAGGAAHGWCGSPHWRRIRTSRYADGLFTENPPEGFMSLWISCQSGAELSALAVSASHDHVHGELEATLERMGREGLGSHAGRCAADARYAFRSQYGCRRSVMRRR
jgi:DNA gyrase inhibitor GyrI